MRTHLPCTRRALTTVASAAALLLATGTVFAQTGVDDDRVSLPEGPGSLEGLGDNVEIDPNMGAMSTSVQVQVPSGFGSLTPNLTLSYSSAGGSGPVGIGWSLPEMSIERMTARRVPLYDTDDFFAANGSDELVQVETESDGDLVYRSRFEKAFTRYTWVQPGSGADGYWIAQMADGTVGYYGADRHGETVDSARSTHPTDGTFRYLLVDHVDPYGHVLHYEYQSSFADGLNNRPLLVGVSWVDDGSGTPLYSAELTYEGRTDAISDAGAGYEERLTRRLTGLIIRNGGETIREYVLSYEDESTSGGFSRLAKVEHYGLGGQSGGELYPAVFEYGYQKGLGVQCDAQTEDCGSGPYVFDMGNVAGGGQLTSGKATLIDINGDGLSDILDTSDAGGHQFYLNTLTPDASGGFDHGFGSAVASGLDTSLVLTNASDTVQTLDINGDGFADLVDTVSGTVLLNDPASPDWMPTAASTDVTALTGLDFTSAKFFDYDNDKKIDVLLATTNSTQVFVNHGNSFEAITVAQLERTTAAPTVHMSDFNGDGLNDVVEILEGGSMQVRLNLGRGSWGEWTGINNGANDPVLDITSTELSQLDLEDLNGDGLDDLVITGSGQIKYALNRSARRFDDWVILDSGKVDGTLPDRTNKTVLYADMNANGSEDVVWFDTSGNVTYLELFPSRPNLLSRIDNNLGFVQKITYGTAAEHAARAAAAGNPWSTALPNATAVVDETDVFVTLTGSEDGTGLHEVITYDYRNGWYDGDEKQFRGFADVTVEVLAAQGQEGGRMVSRYDLGDDGEPHRNGLLLEQVSESGGEVIAELVNTYENCTVAQVPTPADLTARGRKGVYHPCMTAEETLVRERLTSEADWVTLRTEMQYDGYGQVTLASDLGNVDADGDEAFTRTAYYEPTSGFWMLGLVSREESSASDAFAAADTTVTIHHYDGPDFEGLAEGEATHGFLTRTELATAPGDFIAPLRQRRDDHGNAIETLDANASISETDGTDHRRSYVYDETGLFLTTTDLHLGDYSLRRESRYERNFQQPTESTQWMLVEGGEVVTARNSSTVRYDDFGRLVEVYKPGDTDVPSRRITWELGEPFSRIVLEDRTEADSSAFDERIVRCLDGRGLTYQTRAQLDDDRYLVSGFTSYNANGQPVEIFEPFTASGEACSSEPPAAEVLSQTITWDARGRQLERSRPGESIYGERLLERTVYMPLVTEAWDAEDLRAGGAHENTPTRVVDDGLGRAVAIERTLADGTVARTELHYDATNSFAGYTDAEGNRHELVVDLADRVVSATDPNTGTTTFEYDATGNVISSTDARGVTVVTEYDGQNRMVARYDAADPDTTRVAWHYDTVPDGCEVTECTNPVNKVAMATWPVDLGGGRVEQGTDRFGYDQRQRQVFAARRLGMLVDLPVQRTYDNRDRLVTNAYPDGTTLAVTYDRLGRVAAMPGFVSSIEYDARGDWSAISHANGTRLERSLDALRREASRRITSPSGTVVLDHTLERNMDDHLTAITAMDDLVGTADTLHAELDAWYRPTALTLDAETLSLRYDVLDRILNVASDTADSPMDHGELAYTGDAPLAVTSAGALSMAYDVAGQMTARGEATFTRDELGRIREIAHEGEVSGQMVYGASGRVAQRTEDGTLIVYGFDNFEVRDGVSRVYVRHERQHLARRESTALAASIYPDATGDGTITAGDAFVARQQGDEAMPTVHVLGAAAARLLFEQEDEVVALHTDHLGSVVAATDAGGAVRGRRGFYPYGLVRYEAQGSYVDEHGFTGQEHDVATGLVHMDFRELDPMTGRWDRFDPAFVRLDAAAVTGRPGEATTGYAYVANMPTAAVDPTGLNLTRAQKKAFKRDLKGKQKGQEKLIKGLKKGLKDANQKLNQISSELTTTRSNVNKDNLAMQADMKRNEDQAAQYEKFGNTDMADNLRKTNKSIQSEIDANEKKVDALSDAFYAKHREIDQIESQIRVQSAALEKTKGNIERVKSGMPPVDDNHLLPLSMAQSMSSR